MEKSIKFLCPYCSNKIEAESKYFGQDANCPVCNKPLRVPNPTEPAPTRARWDRWTQNILIMGGVLAACAVVMLLLDGFETFKKILHDQMALLATSLIGLIGTTPILNWFRRQNFTGSQDEPPPSPPTSQEEGSVDWEMEYWSLYAQHTDYKASKERDLATAHRRHERLTLMVVSGLAFAIGSCIATILTAPSKEAMLASDFSPWLHPLALASTFAVISFVMGLISTIRLDAEIGGGETIRGVPVAVGLIAACYIAIISLLISAPYQADWFGETSRPGPLGLSIGTFILVLRLAVIPLVSFAFCGLGVMIARLNRKNPVPESISEARS